MICQRNHNDESTIRIDAQRSINARYVDTDISSAGCIQRLVRILLIAMLREDATDGAQSWCPKFYVKESEMGYKVRDGIKTKESVHDVISVLHTPRIISGALEVPKSSKFSLVPCILIVFSSINGKAKTSPSPYFGGLFTRCFYIILQPLLIYLWRRI